MSLSPSHLWELCLACCSSVQSTKTNSEMELTKQASRVLAEELATGKYVGSVVCNPHRPLDEIAFLANESLFLERQPELEPTRDRTETCHTPDVAGDKVLEMTQIVYDDDQTKDVVAEAAPVGTPNLEVIVDDVTPGTPLLTSTPMFSPGQESLVHAIIFE